MPSFARTSWLPDRSSIGLKSSVNSVSTASTCSFRLHKDIRRNHCCFTIEAVRPGTQVAAGLPQDAATALLPAHISGQLAVYAVSDLHCDYPANVAWMHGLPSYKQQQHNPSPPTSTTPAQQQQQQQHTSCCIVAGDVSDDLRILRCAGHLCTGNSCCTTG